MGDSLFGAGLNTAGNILSALPGSSSGQSRALNTGGNVLTRIPTPPTQIAGVLMLAASKIFGGADPKQVPAAQIEQCFEAAAINLENVAKAGMISKDQAAAGMQAFLQQGIAYYGQAQLGKAGEKGAANMNKSIGITMSRLMAMGEVPSVALDLGKARALYVNAAGWYKQSLQAAVQLTDAYLGSLTSGISGKLASVASSPVKLAGVGVGLFALVAVARHFW